MQIKWGNQVFQGATVCTLTDTYADLLTTLDPSIAECIEATLKRQPGSLHLTLLLELKGCTDRFAANLSSAIEQQNNSQQKSLDASKLLPLAKAIYSPYLAHIVKYSSLEGAMLSQQLGNLELTKDDLGDTVSALSLNIFRVMECAEEANKRCKLFTEGYGYPGLFKALDVSITQYIFRKYMKTFTRVGLLYIILIIYVREFCFLTTNFVVVVVIDFFPPQIYLNRYLEHYQSCIKQLDKRKVRQEDWNQFQTCLTLMQTIGEQHLTPTTLPRVLLFTYKNALRGFVREKHFW